MGKSTRVIATGVIALCAALSPVLADQWKAPGKTRTTHRVERGALVTEVDATSPGIAVVQSAGVASIAGDDDGFGFGLGWVPPLTCETFDNRGPEDLGVFDQREPVPGVYESICSFAGSWAQSFTVPTGGVAQFTVRVRILGGSVTTSQC